MGLKAELRAREAAERRQQREAKKRQRDLERRAKEMAKLSALEQATTSLLVSGSNRTAETPVAANTAAENVRRGIVAVAKVGMRTATTANVTAAIDRGTLHSAA